MVDYKEGTVCFFLHPEENWTLGIVTKQEEDTRTVHEADPEGSLQGELEAEIKGTDGLAPYVDGALLKVKDLLNMPYLHDSALLWQVRDNYWDNIVYTNIGPIVLALNPYDFNIPHYQDSLMDKYVAEGKSVLLNESKNITHAWSVAHHAYWAMREFDYPQSILVSGESGAGKTEAAKMVVKYFAKVSTTLATESKKNTAAEITERISKCSPILEAFGNAKTLRNDNSSRFGKFMKIQFDRDGLLVGAHTTNYLLEKSRVVGHASGERSYHSLYQLAAGASDEEREKWKLQDRTQFKWLYFGYEPGAEELAEDAQNYQIVRDAMRIVGMTTEEQESIYSLLSGILHIQTVEIEKDRKGDAALGDEAKETISFVCNDLWRVDPEEFIQQITNNITPLFTKPLTQMQAVDARDAISKALYKEMFEYLVRRINEKVDNPNACGENTWIGLLDIFGFENFAVNTFEQLCINYANEQLQHHYNTFVFAKDIELYKEEGIDIAHVDPPNNQPTIDLIADPKKLGLFALLNDQVKQGGSDEKFLTATTEAHWNKRKHPNIELPRINNNTFIIKHYAYDVTYSTKGMREKNLDTLKDGVKVLFRESKDEVIKILLPEPVDEKKAKVPPTVSNFFRNSMLALMDTINITQPYWIRCVKPHHAKKKRMFQGHEVMNQLRSAGVLETVKIRKSGYAWRLGFTEFWKRFKIIHKCEADGNTDPRDASEELLKFCDMTMENGQLGKTKVFLKDSGMNIMERKRGLALEKYIVLLQQYYRCKVSQWRRKCLSMIIGAKLVHGFCKNVCSQHVFRQKEFEAFCRRLRAALLTQREMRGKLSLNKKHCRYLLKCGIQVEAFSRAKLAMSKRHALFLNKSVEIMQRSMLAKKSMTIKHAQFLRHCVTQMQQCARSKLSSEKKHAYFLKHCMVVTQQHYRAKISSHVQNAHFLNEKLKVIQQFARAKNSCTKQYAQRLRHSAGVINAFTRGKPSVERRYAMHIKCCVKQAQAFSRSKASMTKKYCRWTVATNGVRIQSFCRAKLADARYRQVEYDLFNKWTANTLIMQRVIRAKCSSHVAHMHKLKCNVIMMQIMARHTISRLLKNQKQAEKWKHLEASVVTIQQFVREKYSGLVCRLQRGKVNTTTMQQCARSWLAQKRAADKFYTDALARRAMGVRILQRYARIPRSIAVYKDKRIERALERVRTIQSFCYTVTSQHLVADTARKQLQALREAAEARDAAAAAQAQADAEAMAEEEKRQLAERAAALDQEREVEPVSSEPIATTTATPSSPSADSPSKAPVVPKLALGNEDEDIKQGTERVLNNLAGPPSPSQQPAITPRTRQRMSDAERQKLLDQEAALLRKQQLAQEQQHSDDVARRAEGVVQRTQQQRERDGANPARPKSVSFKEDNKPQIKSPSPKNVSGQVLPQDDKGSGWWSRVKKIATSSESVIRTIVADTIGNLDEEGEEDEHERVPPTLRATPEPPTNIGLTPDDSDSEEMIALKSYIESLRNDVETRARDVELLQRQVQRERNARKQLEAEVAQLQAAQAGGALPQVPISDEMDVHALHKACEQRMEVLNKAFEQVLTKRDDVIFARQKYFEMSQPDGTLKELVGKCASDMQAKCQADLNIHPVKDSLSMDEILEAVKQYNEHYGMVSGDSDDACKVMQYYFDQFSMLKRQMKGKAEKFLSKQQFAGHLTIPLELLLHTMQHQAKVATEEDTLSVQTRADIQALVDMPRNLNRTPGNAESTSEVEKGRLEITSALKTLTEAAKKRIMSYRTVATGITEVKRRTEELGETKSKLSTLHKEMTARKDALTQEEKDLKKLKNEYSTHQANREKELKTDFHKLNDAVEKLRAKVGESWKAVQVDITRLIKLETQRAKIQKEAAFITEAKHDIDAVINPKHEEIKERIHAMLTGAAILSKERACIEDIDKLLETCVRTLKTKVYQKLGDAHSQLYSAAKLHWLKLTDFYSVESRILAQQREELQVQLEYMQNVIESTDITPDEKQQMQELQELKVQRVKQGLNETMTHIQGLRAQFQDIFDFLKKLKTLEFLGNDPKLHHVIQDNFLKEDFWKED